MAFGCGFGHPDRTLEYQHRFSKWKGDFTCLLGAPCFPVQCAFDGLIQYFVSCVNQFVCCHNCIYKMLLKSFVRLELFSSCDVLDGIVYTNDTRHTYSSTKSRYYAELRFWKANSTFGVNQSKVG